jgi:hypothetical protein
MHLYTGCMLFLIFVFMQIERDEKVEGAQCEFHETEDFYFHSFAIRKTLSVYNQTNVRQNVNLFEISDIRVCLYIAKN